MNETTTRGKLHFMKWILSELTVFQGQADLAYSEACIRCMKQIVRLLREEIVLWEIRKLHRLERAGKLTPKERIRREAIIKKHYPRRIDRKRAVCVD